MEYIQEVKVCSNQMFDIFEKSYLADIYNATGKKIPTLYSGYSYSKKIHNGEMKIVINNYSENYSIGSSYILDDKEIVSSYTLLPNGDNSCKVIYKEIIHSKNQKELRGLEKWMAERRFKKMAKKYITGIERHLVKKERKGHE